jgi:hypothetical protein
VLRRVSSSCSTCYWSACTKAEKWPVMYIYKSVRDIDFASLDYERTSWNVLRKCVVRTKFDIYERVSTIRNQIKLFLNINKWLKKSLKIPKGLSESIFRRRTDSTMAKRKSAKEQARSSNTNPTKHHDLGWYSKMYIFLLPLKVL